VFERPEESPVTFSVDLASKDLDLILALASLTGATMPQADANLAVMELASRSGLGDHDMGEVATFLRLHPRPLG
jgi:3-hydroxyisobutyrate dehydrogenase-like beta-hydroxyacid dehydrogenase